MLYVYVTTGIESDISVEIAPAEGAELMEEMDYIVTPDPALTEGAQVTAVPAAGSVPAAADTTEETPEETESSLAETE